MALFTLNFFSRYLVGNTEVSVVMPGLGMNDDPKEFYGSGKRYKVLWLLHGSCGDHLDWIKNTNISRYAEECGLIVVMPSVLTSDYANYRTFADGFRVWDYITEELMAMIYHWFPASAEKEDNFIAGASMGGNGALMFALGHPDLFGGAAILSSTAREIEYLRPFASYTSAQFRKEAGDAEKFPGPNGTGMREKEINQVAKYETVQEFLDSYENAWDRFAEVVKAGKLPKMYVSCGTKDKNVYPRFLRFRKYASDLGADIFFEEVEGYGHEFALWDITLRTAMDYFGISKADDQPPR